MLASSLIGELKSAGWRFTHVCVPMVIGVCVFCGGAAASRRRAPQYVIRMTKGRVYRMVEGSAGDGRAAGARPPQTEYVTCPGTGCRARTYQRGVVGTENVDTQNLVFHCHAIFNLHSV